MVQVEKRGTGVGEGGNNRIVFALYQRMITNWINGKVSLRRLSFLFLAGDAAVSLHNQ